MKNNFINNTNNKKKFQLKNQVSKFVQPKKVNLKNINKDNNPINKDKIIFINNFAPTINIQSNTINNNNDDKNKNLSSLNKIVNLSLKNKKNK